jgi:hypothetical protein
LTGIGALDVLPIDESPQDPGDQAFVLVVWHVLLENHQKFCAIIEEWVNADPKAISCGVHVPLSTMEDLTVAHLAKLASPVEETFRARRGMAAPFAGDEDRRQKRNNVAATRVSTCAVLCMVLL